MTKKKNEPEVESQSNSDRAVLRLERDQYLVELVEKYGDRRNAEFKKESAGVWRYFEAVTARLAGTYTIDKVLAVGGTGIVHAGHHTRFKQAVVVKMNRPVIKATGISMVEHEARVLPSLSHPNIIGVLDLGRLCNQSSELLDDAGSLEPCERPEDCDHSPKLTYIVEPYIEGSKPFFTHVADDIPKSWLYEKVMELRQNMPAALELGKGDDSGQAAGLVTSLLNDIASLFSQWVSVLAVLGKQNYIYIDVKPENVLVDGHLHLTSIDYGSLEEMDPEDNSSVEVIFTDQYAHPDLRKHKTHNSSPNRVVGGPKRSDLRAAFDYYALGMSMLEILNAIAKVRPHVVPQMPLYRSLHFLATRLLDGRNALREGEVLYPYAPKIFPSLREEDYKKLGYENLDDVLRDLDKERGRWNLEQRVPELAAYSKDIVRVVPGYNTVLTPRLKGVIEHPLVARLKHVTQLGLVSLVYPTADHARYDHSLGSYTYTTYYVKSLFNDLGNPLFRNLVAAEDINAVLLAALLHDLGQYPLAHDLEEVHEGIFKHLKIGMALLEDPMPDQRGRTLLEIIEGRQNGWGVTADELRQILGFHFKDRPLADDNEEVSLKTSVLAAIVNGQIDADKADYIIRDTVRCELPYGAQLDLERLLRVLTVAVLPDDNPKRRVALGVYDKGLVSAHAFGQARYELLSTVYWHHTARIIKAMLQYATAMGLPNAAFSKDEVVSNPIVEQLHERLLNFVKLLVPPFVFPAEETPETVAVHVVGLDMVAEPPEEVIDAIPDDKGTDNGNDKCTDWYPGIAWTDWLMLRWIADLPDASAQSHNLIRGIQKRILYKRVVTYSHDGQYADLFESLVELKDWPERLKLCAKLHESVHERLRRDWRRLNTATTMNESDFEMLCASHLLILVDIPNTPRKIGYDRPLGVVPELKEKSYQQDARQAHEDKSWRKIMTEMIQGIAPVRVLCHPDVRNLIGSIYDPVELEMETLLDGILKKYF